MVLVIRHWSYKYVTLFSSITFVFLVRCLQFLYHCLFLNNSKKFYHISVIWQIISKYRNFFPECGRNVISIGVIRAVSNFRQQKCKFSRFLLLLSQIFKNWDWFATNLWIGSSKFAKRSQCNRYFAMHLQNYSPDVCATFLRMSYECCATFVWTSHSHRTNTWLGVSLIFVVFRRPFYELFLECPVLIVLQSLVVEDRMVQPELSQYAFICHLSTHIVFCPGYSESGSGDSIPEVSCRTGDFALQRFPFDISLD